MHLKQVTKSEFYAAVGSLDIQVEVRGQYHDDDYGTNFKLKNGRVVGKTVAIGQSPNYKPDNNYYLVQA